MAKARVINIVATECAPERDAAFNKWYNEVHIPLLFKYKGMKKVTRYKIIDEKSKQPEYLAVYEYDSKESMNGLHENPESKAAIEEMQGSWQGKFDLKWAASYEPIQTWER